MIANFIGGVATGFKVFYVGCLWIGWANTTILLGILKGIVWIFTNAALGISILCEEFLLFLEDVGEAVEWFIGSLVEGLGTAVESILGVGSVVLYTLSVIPSAVRNSIMSFKLGTYTYQVYLVNFIILVKDALLLLGICFWEAFAWIYTALGYLNEAPYIVLLLLARAADNMMSNILSTMETYGFRSACGLVMAYGVYALAKNAGILPELRLTTLIYLGLKRCHSESYRAIRVILVCTSMLLFVLKSAALATGTFFRRQAQALKSASWELYREFICYTPTKAALQIKLEKEKASSQCVVCMDRRRDVMILSCRHLLMCKQCALTVAVSSGECPVCRTPIDNIISVYT